MARLPIPGADQGTWGQILNSYLLRSHNNDGTLKPVPQSKVTNLTTDLGVLSTSIAQKARTVNGVLPDENGDVEIGSRGRVIYVHSGAGGYVLAAGQYDDGVSPREYVGPAAANPTLIAGFVPRPGDIHQETDTLA